MLKLLKISDTKHKLENIFKNNKWIRSRSNFWFFLPANNTTTTVDILIFILRNHFVVKKEENVRVDIIEAIKSFLKSLWPSNFLIFNEWSSKFVSLFLLFLLYKKSVNLEALCFTRSIFSIVLLRCWDQN